MAQHFQTKLPFSVSNKLVCQHNELTSARYNLTAVQKDIVYLLLSQIKRDDEPDKVYRFHLSSLASKNRKRVDIVKIKNSISELLERKIEIKKPTGLLVFPAIFSSIEYIQSNSIIEMKIDSKLRPYLINLKNNFTTFWSGTALNIKSMHAKRIYEMLSQYKDTGFMKISLMDLKNRLYLIDIRTQKESYPRWERFKERILERSRKELEEVAADIKFTYKPIKEGKKCIAIEFYILGNGTSLGIQELKRNMDGDGNFKILTKLVKDFKLSTWQANLIVNNIPIETINKLLYEMRMQKADGRVRNMGAYAFKTFSNHYPNLFKK